MALIIAFPFTWWLRYFHSSFFAYLKIAHPIRRLLSSFLSLQLIFHFLSLIVAFCHCYTYFTANLQSKSSCNIHQSSQPGGFSGSLNSNSLPSLVSFTLILRLVPAPPAFFFPTAGQALKTLRYQKFRI